MNNKIVVTEKDDGNVLEILGKDGILRIAVWFGKRRGSAKNYEIFCPICENDEILNLHNIKFYSPKYNLSKGETPCLCTSRDRKLKALNLDPFIGSFVQTNSGNILKILSCEETNKNEKDLYYVTCNICDLDPIVTSNGLKFKSTKSSLLSGSTPCLCTNRSRKLLRLGIDEFIGRIFETPNSVILVKRFDSLKNNARLYEVECSLCSKDKELFPDKILTTKGHLESGRIPCGCSYNTKWKPYQKVILLNRLCNNLGYKNLTQSLTKAKDNIKLVCDKGHSEFTTAWDSFMNIGTRCPSCASYGFKKSKDSIFYLSRWYGFGESFIKFGITNSSHQARYKQQMTKSKLDHEPIHEFKGSGLDVLTCENLVKSSLTIGVCPKDWLPYGFTETVYDTPENLAEILKIVKESGLC